MYPCEPVSLEEKKSYDTICKKQYFARRVAPAAPLRMAPCAPHVSMMSAYTLWVLLCFFFYNMY